MRGAPRPLGGSSGGPGRSSARAWARDWVPAPEGGRGSGRRPGLARGEQALAAGAVRGGAGQGRQAGLQAVAGAQEEDVGAAAGQLRQQGAAAAEGRVPELEQHDAVPAHLGNGGQGGPGQVLLKQQVEGAGGSVVARDAGVLEVQAGGAGVRGQAQARGRAGILVGGAGAALAGFEDQQQVPRGQGLDGAQDARAQQVGEIGHEFAHLAGVQLAGESSSSAS